MVRAFKPPASYLAAFAAIFALGCISIALINIVVDPYDAFRIVRARGFNLYKIDTGNDRLVKAHVMAREKYDGVILGTSQAQFGIDPASPQLKSFADRFYNAGLLGATPYQLMRYLQHASANNDIHTAILVVDLLMFEGRKKTAGSLDAAFSETRLDMSASGERTKPLIYPDLPQLLFSIDALRMSVATVRKQSPEQQRLLDNGMRSPINLDAEVARKDGARGAFRASERQYLSSYADLQLFDAQGDSRSLKAFDDLVRYARSRNIKLIIVFSPVHALQLEVLKATERYENLECLKTKLVQHLEREGRQSGQTPFTVWDFNAPHELTTEPIPPPGVRMQRFYDSAHFRPGLADIALSRIANGEKAPGDFGIQLTSQNLDAALADIRRKLAAYEISQPGELAEIASIQRSVMVKTTLTKPSRCF